MGKNPIGAEAAKLAGLQIDSLQKLRDGQLTIKQWEMFNNLSLEERSGRLSGKKKRVVRGPDDTPTLFLAGDTDLDQQLEETEAFAKAVLGEKISLRKTFSIPETIPWQKVFAIFDPGFTNREMVEKALKGQNIGVYEEIDVMNYYGAQSLGRQALWLINGSIRPDEDTMGLSPNQLLATGKTYLGLRAYGLAQAKQKFLKQVLLDSKTYCWFPENRLPDGSVAHGNWYPDPGEVRFRWLSPSNRYPSGGARVAITVPLPLAVS